MKLFITLLCLASTQIFAFSVLRTPKSLNATIVHSSVSESDFSLNIKEIGQCSLTSSDIKKCRLEEATASIGTKVFDLDKMVVIDNSKQGSLHAYLFYFYGKVPFLNGKKSRTTRIAVLFDKDYKAVNAHSKIDDLHFTEQMIIEEVKF